MAERKRPYTRSFNGSSSKHICSTCGKIVHGYICMDQWRYKDGSKFFCCFTCYRKYCREKGWLDIPEQQARDIAEYNEWYEKHKEAQEVKVVAKTLVALKKGRLPTLEK